MKLYFKLFLLFTVPLSGSSQELEIGNNNNYIPGGYYLSYTFNQRYSFNDYFKFYLGSTGYYKLKNVKKMEVYDASGKTLFYLLELDTAGKILRTGQLGNQYFTTVEYIIGKSSEQASIVRCYQGNELMRADTNYYKEYHYKNTDTLISFSRRTYVTYKKGELINEQNAYYNENYLNKEITINNPILTTCLTYDKRGKLISEKPDNIYLKKKLKTDYDTSLLYKCRIQIYDEGFYAMSDSGRNEILFENIAKHPFAKKWRSEDKKDCFTDGECFDEPSSLLQSMWCGNSMYRYHESINAFSYGYTQNENGLHENYFTDFYPLDTNKVVPPPVDSLARANSAIVFMQNPGFYSTPRRMSTPVRTINYIFKYEYFEKPK